MSFWENFWDIFGWFFTASVVFVYLFGAFTIIGGLFSDQGLMAERSMERALRDQNG